MKLFVSAISLAAALSFSMTTQSAGATAEAFEAFFPGVKLSECARIEMPKSECQATKVWVVEMADRLWQAKNFRAHDKLLAFKNNSALHPLSVTDLGGFRFAFAYEPQPVGNIEKFLWGEIDSLADCLGSVCAKVLTFPRQKPAAYWVNHVQQAKAFFQCAYQARASRVAAGVRHPRPDYIYDRIYTGYKSALTGESDPFTVCSRLEVDISILHFARWNLPDSLVRASEAQ